MVVLVEFTMLELHLLVDLQVVDHLTQLVVQVEGFLVTTVAAVVEELTVQTMELGLVTMVKLVQMLTIFKACLLL
jgi:hypothetical protein